MRELLLKGALVISMLFMVGCDGLDKPEEAIGGEIVVNFDGDSIKASMIAAETPGIDENTSVYGFKAYKIPYTTTDEEGEEVAVSGLMVVPTGMPDIVYSTLGLSMVSDDHGTIFANRESPTQSVSVLNMPEGSAIILTSLAGFVTLQPDYIGFGDSNDHYHPFIMKKSLANATVDFIVAARKFATDNSIKLNGQLFLTGYSEGGYAALATLQKIESDGEMQVAMAAPMAGPYALEAMAMGVLNEPVLGVPSFMANVGYAYAKAYDKDLATVINEPYASNLETLFNGDLARPEIDPQLTTVTTGADGLFNPVFVNDFFTNPDNWFKKAVQENDIHAWVPQTAVRFVHCKGDSVIPYVIAELTVGTMQAMEAPNVDIVPVEATLGLGDALVDHGDCGAMAYKVTAGIFANARHSVFGY
ncbi:MAG TPA: hypothetical protein EYG98_07625 [Sulfurovum sp.]|nr:hypothetical protein [Sulfurovum sp.]